MRLAIKDADRCVGCQSCMFACVRIRNEAGIARSRLYVKSSGGMSRGFSVVVCRGCEDPQCAKACPHDALILRKGGGVKLDEKKCVGCGACAQACAMKAVFWDDEKDKPLICNACGYCANYCPHGVLEHEKGAEP